MLNRAVEILKTDGLLSLMKRSANFVRRRSLTTWWGFRGYQKLSTLGVSAKFLMTDPSAALATRARFKSEREELNDLLSELQDGDVFFDIGANVGLYTYLAANKINGGKIVAFEPYPPNISQLKQNKTVNPDVVEVREVAVSDSNGTVDLNVSGSNGIGSGTPGLTANSEEETIPTQTVSIDRLVQHSEVPYPNVVKIDVEGAEPLVIEGMEKTISHESCRVLYCEVHLPSEEPRGSIEDYGVDLAGIKSRIENAGCVVAEEWSEGENDRVFLKCVSVDSS